MKQISYQCMKLSILIPVFNEEQTIEKILKKVSSVRIKARKEIIVIDDGSTDDTTMILKRLKKRMRFTIVRHATNIGKGEAIKTGLRFATGDYILIQDADLEYNPLEIPQLLHPLSLFKRKPIAVYGSRFQKKAPSMPHVYLVGNRFLTWMTNTLFDINLSDMETGYKLIPRSFMNAVSIKSSGFDFEPEITIQLVQHHIPIIEVPISYKGCSHLAGKKLRMRQALDAVRILISHRFNEPLFQNTTKRPSVSMIHNS